MFTVEEPRNKERLEGEIPVRTGFIPARRAYLKFSSLMSCVILFKYSYIYGRIIRIGNFIMLNSIMALFVSIWITIDENINIVNVGLIFI